MFYNNNMNTETQNPSQLIEGVDHSFEVAGLGARAYAFCYDLLFRLLLILSLGALWTQFGNGSLTGGLHAIWDSYQFLLIPWLLYHPVMEWLWKGQTLGKKIAGIQVITRRGTTPGLGAVLLRNFMRLIDMLPGTYLLGILWCLGSSLQIRLGDLLTNTVVVYTPDVDALSQVARIKAQGLPEGLILDPEKKQYIEELLGRWESMEIERRCKLAKTCLMGLSLPTPLGFIDAQYDKAIHAILLSLLKR